MTQEQAFENFVATQLSLYTLNQGVSLYDAAKLSWQTSRASLKQELLSDDMVGVAVNGYQKRLAKGCSRDTDGNYIKAALQAVVDGL